MDGIDVGSLYVEGCEVGLSVWFLSMVGKNELGTLVGYKELGRFVG